MQNIHNFTQKFLGIEPLGENSVLYWNVEPLAADFNFEYSQQSKMRFRVEIAILGPMPCRVWAYRNPPRRFS